jgi:hypothetical protein
LATRTTARRRASGLADAGNQRPPVSCRRGLERRRP